MSTAAMAPHRGPATHSGPATPAAVPADVAKRGRHGNAWAVMLGCGATSLLYNIVHAVRHEGASSDWVNVLIAVIYGVAPVAISMLTSHMATAKRAAWEVLVMLAVMLAAMAMSITAAAELVRPVAGPYACWLFPAALDVATLMAFRMIVVPIVEATRGRSWWTRPLGVGRATANAGPANSKVGNPANGKAGNPANGRVTSRRRPPATGPANPAAKPPATAAPVAGTAAEPAPAPAAAAPRPARADDDGPSAEVITLGADDGSRRRGPVEQKMRDEWDNAIAEGRIPTGGDLNRAVGQQGEYSLGKRHAARWRKELTADDLARLAAAGDQTARKMLDGHAASPAGGHGNHLLGSQYQDRPGLASAGSRP